MRNRIALALLLGTVGSALAHVTLAEPKAGAGSYYVGAFRVGHGCSGSPTTALRIEIPDGIASARPQPKPGWTVEIETAPLAKPVPGEMGETVTSRVTAVTLNGGSLPGDQFDQFLVLMKLPAVPGQLLFPATQTCAKGEEHWSDAPMAGMRMPHPAPALTVTPATGGGDTSMGGMHGM
jgi:uncharacterized protein YcnI